NKKEDKCSFDPDAKVTADDPYSRDIRHNIEECITGSSLVQPNVKLDVTSGGLKTILNGWIQKIAGFLALGAMFAIAFGSLKLTLSRGEDENIKKAKDIIKWGILGFLAVISAGLLIATVVNLIYSLAG
ncbi:pilin, partial [Candidatus Gracilibacteria bacterium]|nr:pilin [Candidatus Gracilibacteria bacterium]